MPNREYKISINQSKTITISAESEEDAEYEALKLFESGSTNDVTNYTSFKADTPYNKAKQAMVDLIDATNVMGADNDVAAGILAALNSQHRTLQQSFMRSFVKSMVGYQDTATDYRNEDSVRFAKDLLEMVEKNNIYFPFV